MDPPTNVAFVGGIFDVRICGCELKPE